MRAANNKILHKKYLSGFISLILLCIPLFCLTAKASEITTYELGTGNKAYNFDEILSYYQSFSASYELNSITYRLEALNGTIASENYNSIQNQYAETVSHLASLKEAKKNYLDYRENTTDEAVLADIDAQIKSLDSQIAQYNEALSSSGSNAAQAKLQEDIASFYTIYNNEILQETRNKLKNEFMKKCYNLIVTKEKMDYYQSYNRYLELVLAIENIKYKKGITGKADLDLARVNLLNNDLEISKCQLSYDTSFSYIKDETNLYDTGRIIFPLSLVKEDYNSEQTVKNFISANTNIMQLHNYVRSYSSYLSGCSGLSSIQASLQIDNYILQDEELRENIKAFVQNAILSYEISFQSLHAAEEELQQKVSQLNIITIKKEHKMATEIDLLKAKYEKESIEANYYQYCYDNIIWQNILDNNLFNVTP